MLRRALLRAPVSYDFVVVGGGAGGAAVAGRLSEDASASVLLLEAGPAQHPLAAVPAACGELQHTEVDWRRRCHGGGIGRGLKDGMVNLPSGKMLGGSTAINYMAYVRGSPKDYDSWAAAGANGWSWKEVLPYFKKSEVFSSDGVEAKWVDPAAHGAEGRWAVSFRNPQLEPVQSFLAAAEAQGFRPGDYNSAARGEIDAQGRGVVSPHQFSIRQGQRSSAATAFLDPAMARPNLTVSCLSLAQRVLLEQGRAVGVQYLDAQGEMQEVRCRQEVVLAAGSYATPGLLLRSGIGPKQELSEAGVETLLDLPQVGKNLKDHLYTCIPISGVGSTASQLQSECLPGGEGFQRYLQTGQGLAATSLYEASAFYSSGFHPVEGTQDCQVSYCASTSTPELWSRNFGIADFTPENWRIDAMFNPEVPSSMLVATLNQPLSRGSVTLAGEDVKIDHNYLGEELDVRMFVAACKEAMSLLEQPSMKHAEVLVPQVLLEKHGNDLQNERLWEDYVRHYASTIYHPVSSCAINQVVDSECRVMGLQNLRVADGSVMPDTISGNTQAACVMIGEKVAAMLAASHGLNLA